MLLQDLESERSYKYLVENQFIHERGMRIHDLTSIIVPISQGLAQNVGSGESSMTRGEI
jgi:hypothetical protein